MKTKDMKSLKTGDFIEHKHFGLCFVSEIMENETGFWALVISPLEMKGISLLRQWSRCSKGNSILEDSNRLIIKKVENPILPILIIKGENYEVHKWKDDSLGEIKDGILCTEKLAEFETFDEVKKYQMEFGIKIMPCESGV